MDTSKFEISLHEKLPDEFNCQLYPRSSKIISTLMYEHDFLLLANIHHFNDEKIHYPGMSPYSCTYKIKYESFNYYFTLAVRTNDISQKDEQQELVFLTNDISEEDILQQIFNTNDISQEDILQQIFNTNDISQNDKRYVSVILRACIPLEAVDGVESCSIISFIDSSNQQKFTQFFTKVTDDEYDKKTSFTVFRIDNYLSREYLLKEAEEFLPNNCLKLHISINFQIKFLRDPQVNRTKDLLLAELSALKFEINPKFKIREKGLLLAMFENDFLEKREESAHVPEEHCRTLGLIYKILESTGDIKITPFNESYYIRILANFYDVGLIFEECRGILKSFLYSEDADVRKYAQENITNLYAFNEPEKEILERFKENSREIFAKQEECDGIIPMPCRGFHGDTYFS